MAAFFHTSRIHHNLRAGEACPNREIGALGAVRKIE